jgi:hypothetical protein
MGVDQTERRANRSSRPDIAIRSRIRCPNHGKPCQKGLIRAQRSYNMDEKTSHLGNVGFNYLWRKVMKFLVISAALAILATPSFAECPASAPFSPSEFQDGDQRVDAAWLEENLAGMRVVFDDGTEVYGADGIYSYVAGSQQWDAPGYRFYDNGVRCIGYGTPRFDYYLVNGGQLILINSNGERFEGQLTN